MSYVIDGIGHVMTTYFKSYIQDHRPLSPLPYENYKLCFVAMRGFLYGKWYVFWGISDIGILADTEIFILTDM